MCGSPELGGRLGRVPETESFTGKDCRRLETQAFPLKDKIPGPPEMPPKLLVLSKVPPLSLSNQPSQGHTQVFAEGAPSRQSSHGSRSRVACTYSGSPGEQEREEPALNRTFTPAHVAETLVARMAVNCWKCSLRPEADAAFLFTYNSQRHLGASQGHPQHVTLPDESQPAHSTVSEHQARGPHNNPVR